MENKRCGDDPRDRIPVYLGRISALFPDGRRGIVRADDGREFAFPASCVDRSGFDRLQAGLPVLVMVVETPRGPMISHLRCTAVERSAAPPGPRMASRTQPTDPPNARGHHHQRDGRRMRERS